MDSGSINLGSNPSPAVKFVIRSKLSPITMEKAKPEKSTSKPILSKDIPWNQIKGEFCRVKAFLPFGKVEKGKVEAPLIPNPYAILDVESPKKLPPKGAFLPVAHKIDFKHLWEAFRERGVKEDEEVLVVYHPEAPSNVPEFTAKMFESAIFPKLHIWICKKGLLEKLYDEDYQEKVGYMKFFSEEAKPIKEWSPFQEVK